MSIILTGCGSSSIFNNIKIPIFDPYFNYNCESPKYSLNEVPKATLGLCLFNIMVFRTAPPPPFFWLVGRRVHSPQNKGRYAERECLCVPPPPEQVHRGKYGREKGVKWRGHSPRER